MNKLTISHKVLNNIIQESNLVSYKSAFKKKINFQPESFFIELQLQAIQVLSHVFLIEIAYINSAIVIICL